jgi:2-iminobutanoate/2-iminopropanoate deaminase
MPNKEMILPEGGAKPLAAYSPGIRYAHLLFTAGQIGLDPATGKLVEGGLAAEARQALENLSAILKAGGASFERVIKVTVFLADMADYAAFNEIYAEYVQGDPPARSAVQVGGLPAGAQVEIEAIAGLA